MENHSCMNTDRQLLLGDCLNTSGHFSNHLFYGHICMEWAAAHFLERPLQLFWRSRVLWPSFLLSQRLTLNWSESRGILFAKDYHSSSVRFHTGMYVNEISKDKGGTTGNKNPPQCGSPQGCDLQIPLVSCRFLPLLKFLNRTVKTFVSNVIFSCGSGNESLQVHAPRTYKWTG